VFCGNCGTELAAGTRFCPNCGKAQSGPATPPVPPPLAAPQHALQSPDQRRPRWLAPVLAAAALVLVAAIVGAIIIGSSSDEPDPAENFLEEANALLAPVDQAGDRLGEELAEAERPADAVATRPAADELADAATRASGALSVLQLAPADERARRLLEDALTATRDYGRRVAAASEDLSSTRARAAETAGQEARIAFVAASAAAPGLATPSERAFTSAAGLTAIADAQHAGETTQEAARTAARAYVERIDRLLTNSAETRGDLGELITDVQNGTIASSEARARIQAIISQRQDLQNAVAAIDTPSPFRRSSELLRRSIRASLDDDFAIEGWINAWYDGDTHSFERFYREHLAATASASSAKREFVREYDRARRLILRLGASPAGSRY
jgi:zinc-ribbon domain